MKTKLKRKIFAGLLVLSLGSALLMLGCDRSATRGGNVDQRLADLEKQVGMLKEQNRDVRAKLKAANSFGSSGLADFFAHPEFWQCTYDSSWSDCSSRCSQLTSQRYLKCLTDHPEGPERQRCVRENAEAGTACLKGCPVQASPTEPPGCIGGSGPSIL